jgi:GTP-binding protein
VREELESLMVRSSFDALDKSNIVLLMIDAHDDPFADQERKLAFYAFTERYKALMVVLNKIDLLDEAGRALLQERIEQYRLLTRKVPLIEVSCATGTNVGKIMPRVNELWQRYSQWLPESEVQRICISEMAKRPMMRSGNKLQLYSVRQRSTAPLVFEMVVNNPLWFDDAEKGFFENLLRARYDLLGVPLKFVFIKHR